MSLRTRVRKFFHSLGYDISAYDRNSCGQNPFLDMGRFVADSQTATIFDVGANAGHFLKNLRLHYPLANVHSFEPSPTTYRQLVETAARYPRTNTWECGMGSIRGPAKLLENAHSTMSSFLELGERGWGKVEKHTAVEIRTVDDLCDEQAISHIDILKTDTQGFDLEVLQGARRMLTGDRIRLIYSEVIFAELYKGIPPFDEFYRFLRECNFVLVGFYKMHFSQQVAGWADALFVNKRLLDNAPKPSGENGDCGDE
ncbi:MAG: FkbM family methyltransferase [Pirellulales bacterium]